MVLHNNENEILEKYQKYSEIEIRSVTTTDNLMKAELYKRC